MMIDPAQRSTAKDLLRQSDFLKNEIIKYGIQNNPLTLSDDGSSSHRANKTVAAAVGPNSNSQQAAGSKSQGGNRTANQSRSNNSHQSQSHTASHSQNGTRPKSLNRLGKK